MKIVPRLPFSVILRRRNWRWQWEFKIKFKYVNSVTLEHGYTPTSVPTKFSLYIQEKYLICISHGSITLYLELLFQKSKFHRNIIHLKTQLL